MLTFEQIIFKLNQYWEQQGCAILQPYDAQMGAGTFHTATVLHTMSKKHWNVAYVQPSRRPGDSRFGNHPNRLQHYYQYQVILKPSPDNIQELYLESLKVLGLDFTTSDIRFVEDDWESPTLGAAGLGWEVWCNGMEVSQFTFMQQICGIPCRPVAGEITYGLERVALYVQKVNNFKDIVWSETRGGRLTYGDLFYENEKQFSHYNLELADTDILIQHFIDAEKQCEILINAKLALPAYDQCINASHTFNMLNSRGAISVTERAAYIARIRNLAKACCTTWVETQTINNN